jgi:hypothetical protein
MTEHLDMRVRPLVEMLNTLPHVTQSSLAGCAGFSVAR